jgi:hypothetical protein
MNRVRFESIVAAYGANPRRWPAQERDAAHAFAEREKIDLSEARTIDALLESSMKPAPPSDLLTARILRASPKQSRSLTPAWALAACAVFGVLVGYGAGAAAPAGLEVESVLAAAFDAPGGEWLGEDI